MSAPFQVVGSGGQRLCDGDDRHPGALSGIANLAGRGRCGLLVEDQRGDLVAVDHVDHGGDVNWCGIGVLLDGVGENRPVSCR